MYMHNNFEIQQYKLYLKIKVAIKRSINDKKT